MNKQLDIDLMQTYSVLLGGGDLLDGEGIVEQGMGREVLQDVLLDKLHTEIWVVDALDLVADTADCERGLGFSIAALWSV